MRGWRQRKQNLSTLETGGRSAAAPQLSPRRAGQEAFLAAAQLAAEMALGERWCFSLPVLCSCAGPAGAGVQRAAPGLAASPPPRCAGAPPVLRAPPWGQAEARPGCGPVGGPGFSGAHGWAGLWAPGDGSCCAMAGAGADSPGSWRGALGHGGALGTDGDSLGWRCRQDSGTQVSVTSGTGLPVSRACFRIPSYKSLSSCMSLKALGDKRGKFGLAGRALGLENRL